MVPELVQGRQSGKRGDRLEPLVTARGRRLVDWASTSDWEKTPATAWPPRTLAMSCAPPLNGTMRQPAPVALFSAR